MPPNVGLGLLDHVLSHARYKMTHRYLDVVLA